MRIGENNYNPKRIIDSTEYANEKIEKLNKFHEIPIPQVILNSKSPGDNVVAILTHHEETPSGNVELWKEWHYGHNLICNAGDEYYARRAVTTGDSAANSGTNQNFARARLELATSTNGLRVDNSYGYLDGSPAAAAGGSETLGTTNGGFSGWNGTAHTDRLGVGTPDSQKNISSGYPKISDNASDNSANSKSDTLAYQFEYAVGDAVGTGATSITNGAIFDNRGGTFTPTVNATGAAVFILNHFQFAAAFAKTSNDTLKVFVNHTFANA